MDGVLNLDKPGGWTSFDVVARVRTISGERRVGHAGTLDPEATGVLLVCLGRATKVVRFLQDLEKTYLAELALGASTDTDDATGEVISRASVPELDAGLLARLQRAFTGELEQIPPAYSALKHRGERLYRLAREGRPVLRGARRVTIKSIRILDAGVDFLKIEVRCSKGTYIRALARDMGDWLGCGAHLRGLRRTAIGPFRIEGAVPVHSIRTRGDLLRRLLPVGDALAHLPAVRLGEGSLSRLRRGAPLTVDPLPSCKDGASVRVEDGGGVLVGVARVRVVGERMVLERPRLFLG